VFDFTELFEHAHDANCPPGESSEEPPKEFTNYRAPCPAHEKTKHIGRG